MNKEKICMDFCTSVWLQRSAWDFGEIFHFYSASSHKSASQPSAMKKAKPMLNSGLKRGLGTAFQSLSPISFFCCSNPSAVCSENWLCGYTWNAEDTRKKQCHSSLRYWKGKLGGNKMPSWGFCLLKLNFLCFFKNGEPIECNLFST